MTNERLILIQRAVTRLTFIQFLLKIFTADHHFLLSYSSPEDIIKIMCKNNLRL